MQTVYDILVNPVVDMEEFGHILEFETEDFVQLNYQSKTFVIKIIWIRAAFMNFVDKQKPWKKLMMQSDR